MKDGKGEGGKIVRWKAEKKKGKRRKGKEVITVPVSNCCHCSDIADTTPEQHRIYSVIHQIENNENNNQIGNKKRKRTR